MSGRKQQRRTEPANSAAGSGEPARDGQPLGARAKLKRNLWKALVPGLMVWFEAALVRLSGGIPGGVAVLIAALATVGVFLHIPLLARRSWFRLSLGILCLIFLGRLFFFRPDVMEMGFIALPRSLTIVMAEFFFGWQALVLWRWRWHESLPIAFPCLALFTCILTLNRSLSGDALGLYVCLVTVCLLLPALMASAGGRGSRWRPATLPWSGRLVLALVCGTVLLGTWATTAAWSRWLPDAQLWFATQVGRTLNYRYRLQDYVRSGSLTAIRLENSMNPSATALRVRSDQPPGYLRGRAFDYYRDGVWHVRLRQRRKLDPLEAVPDRVDVPAGNLSVFRIPDGEEPSAPRRMTIENDPRRGQVFFTPLGCRYFMGTGGALILDEHSVVHGGISAKKPYVTVADRVGGAARITTRQKRALLKPLTGLGPRVADLARDVCRRSNTPQDKIRAVRAYFRNNYEYSLEAVEVPRGEDPLNHFLMTRHAAHCELFASGAVALLRLQGVPTRYVTGYRVLEPKEDHWIARNRDAHAWAEAYDEQRQRWVIVEATPGFRDPTRDDSSGLDEQSGGLQGGGLAFAAENAGALAQWWRSRPVLLKIAVSLLLGIGAAALVFVYLRRRQITPHGRAPTVADPEIRPWRRLLTRMDRRLKRNGLVRHRAETLHQFAARIRALAGEEDIFLLASADWYAAYAGRRFRKNESGPPGLPALGRRTRKDTGRA